MMKINDPHFQNSSVKDKNIKIKSEEEMDSNRTQKYFEDAKKKYSSYLKGGLIFFEKKIRSTRRAISERELQIVCLRAILELNALNKHPEIVRIFNEPPDTAWGSIQKQLKSSCLDALNLLESIYFVIPPLRKKSPKVELSELTKPTQFNSLPSTPPYVHVCF